MGLFQKAYETYDSMEHLTGIYEEGKEPLAPIGHIVTRAKIEVTIDINGHFVSASNIPIANQKIIIPVTESSSNRTSGSEPHPHPLCEQVGYLDGSNKSRKEKYLSQLHKWADRSGNEKLIAIYKYVSEYDLLSDLKNSGVLSFDDKGNNKNEKDLVCWRVIGTNDSDSAVWIDKDLQREYVSYYLESNERSGTNSVSYISGELGPIADLHMKGVVPFAGNAKLISANDDKEFSYRGRFLNRNEALSVSYLDSQKAHNALKWVISNQGIRVGNRVFACWNPKGAAVPLPTLPIPLENVNENREFLSYREELRKTINGWKDLLPEDSDVVIASFEAATSGRLATTYFNDLQGSDFLNRLMYWDETCCWYDTRWGASSPLLYNIVRYAFGLQRGDKDIEVDERLLGQHMQRLLICRLEGASFPQDIMKLIVQRASMPECYTQNNREKIMFTACAVVRKYRKDRFKEEWDMALEPSKKDRSYQYGRLLAVLEKAERDTYDIDDKREPNAIRLQSIFVQRPEYTSKIILEQVKNAYYPRLSPNRRSYYERVIGEIMLNISDSAEETNKPLKETYVMGYYLQKNYMYTKKDDTNKEEEIENE